MPNTIDSFVARFVAALREENAAIFAGAGLSIPTGLVDWRALLRDVAAEIGLDVDRETDLISVAQFHVNERAGRHGINQALVSEFAERATLTTNHRLLASLPIKTYWTTNYDTLLETALREAHKRPDVKSSPANLATTLPRRDAVIYKMHGDVAHPERAVVTRDDYEAYAETHRLFSIALHGDLVAKTFLFIGFSFSDPNLAYILGRIRLLLGENRRDHYCLLRRVARNDCPSEEDYIYARLRQDLQVRDLRRYGIIGILVDDFAGYTQILQRIVAEYRRGRIFVSGSASTFAPWNEDQGQRFVRDFGSLVVETGFDLVTGFGLGVGSYLLNGALESLGRDGSFFLHDRVILRPFPQGITDSAERAARWTEYRREMVLHAGIAVFLFGNRPSSDGSIVEARGVQEEFALAAESGAAVVPVGATGHAAAQLHAQVLRDFERYYPDRPDLLSAFTELGQALPPERVLERLMAFLKQLRGQRRNT